LKLIELISLNIHLDIRIIKSLKKMSDTNKRTRSSRSSVNSQIFNRKRGKRLTSSVAEEGDKAKEVIAISGSDNDDDVFTMIKIGIL
jgi:hypothetical protein